MSTGLETQALNELSLKTLEAVDLYGNPAVNITFSIPEPVEDLWQYAEVLEQEYTAFEQQLEAGETIESLKTQGLEVDRWETRDMTSAWSFTITGASTVREPIVTSGYGAIMLINLQRTVEKFEGASLDSIVAADPQNLWLKDTKGNYWRVYDQSLVTPEELEKVRAVFDEVVKANSTPEFVAYMQQTWRILTDPSYQLDEEDLALYDALFEAFEADDDAEIDRITDMLHDNMVEDGLAAMHNLEMQSSDESWGYWRQFTDEDGSLDVTSYQANLQAEAASKRVDWEGHTGFLTSRRWIQVGHIGNTSDYHGTHPNDYIGVNGEGFYFGKNPGDLQATQGGFFQSRRRYNEKVVQSSYNPSQHYFTGIREYPQLPHNPRTANQFSTIACVTGRHMADKALGCGPSAFIGLVGRKFNDGARIDGMYLGRNTWQQLRIRMLDEIGINGRPRIANYMGTCYIGQNQSMTTGRGFRDGGNRFLRDANATLHGRPLYFRGNISAPGEHKFAANAKKNILKDQIGRDNNPVVAEYSLRVPDQAHFAPIGRYFISIGVAPTLRVMTTDHFLAGWYSLSNPWILAELGTYYIDD